MLLLDPIWTSTLNQAWQQLPLLGWGCGVFIAGCGCVWIYLLLNGQTQGPQWAHLLMVSRLVNMEEALGMEPYLFKPDYADEESSSFRYWTDWKSFITGNVHIDHFRGHPTCGAGDATLCCCCASCCSLSPENAIYLAGTGCAGPYLYGSNAVSCGSEEGC